MDSPQFSPVELMFLYDAFIPYMKRQLNSNKKALEKHKISQVTVEHHEKIYGDIYQKLKPFEDYVFGGVEG